MKKTILIGLFLLFFLCLNAQRAGQTSYGISVGGNIKDHYSVVQVSSTGLRYHDEEVAGQISATAEVSKFLTDGFRLTFSAVYGLYIPDSPSISRVHALAIGPSLAFYCKLADDFYLAPEIGAFATWGWTKVKNSAPNAVTTSPAPVGMLLVASLLSFEYKVSDKMGIAFSAGSLEINRTPQSATSDKVVTKTNISLNGTSSVGLRFYF